MPTWWTLSPLRAPLITGWAAGPAAEKLAGLDRRAIDKLALDVLSSIFGTNRSDLERLFQGSYLHDWRSDPFSRGAYSYVRAGGIDAPAALAEPVEDTLYFAGEAADIEGHFGTVHGAMASGRHAAGMLAARGT